MVSCAKCLTWIDDDLLLPIGKYYGFCGGSNPHMSKFEGLKKGQPTGGPIFFLYENFSEF